MKENSSHNGLWIGLVLSIVALMAVAVLLVWGLFFRGSSHPAEKEDPHSSAKGLDEAALARINTVQETLEELRISADYQAAEPAARAQAVTEVLEKMVSDGHVKSGSLYYDEEGGYISYELSSGVLAAEQLKESENEDGGLPLSSPLLTALPSAAVPDEKNGFADALILNGMTDRQQVMDYCRTLQTVWTMAGLNTELNTGVTLDTLQTLASYEFVYVKMHGICLTLYSGGKAERTSLIALEQKQNSYTDKRYEDDLLAGRVVLLNGCYSISPGFIRKHYKTGDLEGNIIFLGCCELMGKNGEVYDGWTDAFKDRSLSAFIAFHNANYTFYNLYLVESFTEGLLSGQTARAAFEEALTAHGANDAIWYGQNESATTAGTPMLSGDGQARLENLSVWRGTYYGFVMCEGYRDSGQLYDTANEDAGRMDISFALHDMDEDGIPELIANSGYALAGTMGYIYGIQDRDPVFIGSGPENLSSMYYSPEWPGLFEIAEATSGGGSGCYFWELADGRLSDKLIATESGQNTQVEDAGMYAALEKAREEQSELLWFTAAQLKATGWNAFIESYYERVRLSATVREIKASGLSSRMAQAYLDLLPEESLLSGERYAAGAFPDINDDGIPELLLLTRSVDEPYGYPITTYNISVYSAESGTAVLLYQDILFSYGGVWRTACRIYQTESSSDLIICVADTEALYYLTDYVVLSYKNGTAEATTVRVVEDSENGGASPTISYYLNGSEVPEQTFRQYEPALTAPVKEEFFHGVDTWGGDMWDEFFGGRIPSALSRAAAVRILTSAGAVLKQREEVIVDSGSCGENVFWSLNDRGALRISGKGEMTYYNRLPFVPWSGKAHQISSVIFEDGVTCRGGYVFGEMWNMQSLRIGDGFTALESWMFGYAGQLSRLYIDRNVTSIEAGALAGCTKLTDIYYSGSREEWEAVMIGQNNSPVMTARIHFNCKELP